MKTVWKYPIPTQDDFTLVMPEPALILRVGTQRGEPYVWALVDTTKPSIDVALSLRSTGHDATGVGTYIGTFQVVEGALVFHLFYGGGKA